MTQALQTSATGINVGQQQINVIANNVANINTVAYKSANMTFETLFSNTLSHGSAATKEGGGTNPKQIGLGVKIGGISRNFEIGTFVNTGRDTDVMISGNGYFVVQDSDGKQYYTRDGVFTTDSDGNLVTQSGMKVVGATTPYSGTASNTTVRIPTNLKATVTNSNEAVVSDKLIKDLNDVAISSGDFNIIVKERAVDVRAVKDLTNVKVNDGSKFEITLDDNGGNSQTIEFAVDTSKTMGENVKSWNDKITNYNGTATDPIDLKFSFTDGKVSIKSSKDLALADGTDSNFLEQANLSADNLTSILLDTDTIPHTISFTVNSLDTMGNNVGAWDKAVIDYNAANKTNLDLDFKITGDGQLQISSSDALEFEPIDTNLFAETKISPVNLTSKVLNYSAEIQDLLDYNDPAGIAVSSVTIIDENGILSCSYSDGSNLTTQINELNQAEWRYTTPDGTVISGTDVTPKGSINVNSNMIVELASFVNEEGLVSINNNLWQWGPDAGEIFYGMAGEMAFGSLESGGYEGSNVDIAIELSNMISAQRLIQMNSRVFGTASSVMETLAYLGQ